MGVIIEPTTAAKDSQPFVVQRGETVGVSADSLTGEEVVTIKKMNAFGAFRATAGAGSTCTASAPDSSIIASGTYVISKPVTVSPVGVTID